MLTIWTSTATTHRKWAIRAATAAVMAALTFSGLALASQAQADAAPKGKGNDNSHSVRWR